MSASSIPAAIDALIAALEARPGLAGVQVVDGGAIVELDPDVITIGVPSPERTAVDGEQAPAGLGALASEEVYDLTCEVSVWRGDSNSNAAMKACRDRAFEIYAECLAQLRNGTGDPRLGGAVRSAIAQGPVSLEQGPALDAEGEITGLVALITFTVRCSQRT